MGAKCRNSHTLSKWAIWHYPPFNTPNGRQRKYLLAPKLEQIYRQGNWQPIAARYIRTLLSVTKCLEVKNGFRPYLLYLRGCICGAQIRWRYQPPKAPILLFKTDISLHFERPNMKWWYKRQILPLICLILANITDTRYCWEFPCRMQRFRYDCLLPVELEEWDDHLYHHQARTCKLSPLAPPSW